MKTHRLGWFALLACLRMKRAFAPRPSASSEMRALSRRVKALESLTHHLAEKCMALEDSARISEWNVDSLWKEMRGSRRTIVFNSEATISTAEAGTIPPGESKKKH